MSNKTIEACPQDGPLVGKRDILNSDNVEAAPSSVNRPIPVPSVYVDERGEIHNLRVGSSRINLLYTRKGVMRSGDIHENTQHDFVFSENVEVWRLCQDGTTDKAIYKSFDYIRIEPFTPHVFHFLTDTIMAEWWEPQGFYAWFYKPYRKRVQESFQRRVPGRFRLLKPENDGSKLSRFRIGGSTTMMLSTLSLGLALGYWIGSRRRI